MGNATVSESWEKRNAVYLTRCAGKKIMVAYSGGKDSSVCIHLLRGVKEKYGFEVEAHLYAFPRHLYSPAYRDAVSAYWESQGVPFGYHEAALSDPDILGLSDPCLLCQKTRKKAMALLFSQLGIPMDKLVIVSGHSLWDLAGYALEHLINHELAQQKPQNADRARDRFLEISQRFYPYLNMKEGYAVYRPMHFLNQEEIRQLLQKSGAPPEDSACQFAVNRPKKFLGKYFEKFEIEFTYEGVMAFADRHLALQEKSIAESINKEEFLGLRY
jgi:tRNA(Ile)-lysidine synthase TilS/MesJ